MALLGHKINASVGAADAITASMDTTGATLIVVGLENIVNAITTSAITETGATNTWTYGTQLVGTSSRVVRMAYCINPNTNATHVFKFTAANGANFPVIAVTVYSNTPAASFVTEAAGADVPAATTTVQPGSVTPSNANNLLVTFLGGDAYTAISVNQSFTATDTVGKVGGSSSGGGMAYIIQTAATAKNPTWTVTTNDATIMALMMEFKENGGGGGGARPLFRDSSSLAIGAGGSYFQNPLQMSHR